MDLEAIATWRSRVVVGHEPSSSLTFMHLPPALPAGRLHFLNFPAELRNKIYGHALRKRRSFSPRAASLFSYGWRLSHDFNFALFRVNKQVYKEASSVLYDELSLVLAVTNHWAPEWKNLNLGLPGTTHIRVCEINLAVTTANNTDERMIETFSGTPRLLQGLIKQLNSMPNLRKVHFSHAGTVYTSRPAIYYHYDLDFEIKWFGMLEGFEYVTSYKAIPSLKSEPVVRLSSVASLLSPLSGQDIGSVPDRERYARKFTCYVQRREQVVELSPPPEGPDLSMIPEASTTDDTLSVDDGVENGMSTKEPHHLFSSEDLDIAEGGMKSEDEHNLSETPRRSESVDNGLQSRDNSEPTQGTHQKDVEQNPPGIDIVLAVEGTSPPELELPSDSKADSESDTKTEERTEEDILWPEWNSFGSDHKSGGGSWFPTFADYSWL